MNEDFKKDDVPLIRKYLESEAPNCRMTDEAVGDKWEEFSAIQEASWLMVSKENAQRFAMWLKSGNPDDAWS